MTSWISSIFSYFWPGKNDLYVSRKLLASLPLQPSTKNFTLALRDPENQSSVVYLLATVVLSEQSVADTQDLIRVLKPNSVIVQVGYDVLDRIQMDMLCSVDSEAAVMLPTSAVRVIKESFFDGHNLGKYMKIAETEVLRAIFGTTFTSRITAAKRVAGETNASFYYLEGPVLSSSTLGEDSNSALDELTPGLISKRVVGLLDGNLELHAVSKSLMGRFPQADVKNYSISSSLQDSLHAILGSLGFNGQLDDNQSNKDACYDCPLFAQSFYPLLVDLCSVYKDLPGMTLALERTQKLLKDVEFGKHVDSEELALSQCFRLAMEGLRFSMNVATLTPLKVDNSTPSKVNFDDLPYEDKCYAILAQALKLQALESGTVVAVLDALTVDGIRRHWKTLVPNHIAILAKECLLPEAEREDNMDADDDGDGVKRKSKLLEKPIVIVSAGAAAAAGVASISHLAPFSTAIKIVTLKIPTLIKLVLMQTNRSTGIAISKLLSPTTKLLVPSAKGLGTSKMLWLSKPVALKSASGGWKLQTAAHSVIATAEKFSYNAIRTSFYNMMWNRKRKIIAGRPWLSFGASVTVCATLLAFGDGIENAIEAIPEASSIAHIGRGVNNLCHASEALKQKESTHHWETMYRKLYGFLNRKG